MPADTAPLYPHHRDDPERESDCRCGALSVRDPRVGESWGRNCPAAMREEIARLKAELAEALATLANERERTSAMLVRRAEGHEAHLRAHPNAGSISRRSHKCRADELRVMADLISRAAIRDASAAKGLAK